MQEVAEKLGHSAAQISLAWVLGCPGITAPIFGATEAAHVDEAADALSIELSAQDRAYLEGAYETRPLG